MTQGRKPEKKVCAFRKLKEKPKHHSISTYGRK